MLLIELFSSLKNEGIILNDTQRLQVMKYLSLLEEKNKVMDLTANDTREEMVEKNFYDSFMSAKLIPNNTLFLLDLGSGAGFPGILYAILYPKIHIVLLEPMRKRSLFLQECIDSLGLINCEVVSMRAEDYVKLHRESFDVVSARAVAKLSILLELALPLLKVQGKLIALKGPRLYEEEKEAQNAMNLLHVNKIKEEKFILPTNKEVRINALYLKNKKTEEKYPRLFAQIKKKPL